MKKWLIVPVLSLVLSVVPLCVAQAEHEEDLDKSAYNPNNSSYPVSNEPNQPPNEPDHSYGKSSSTYKLPDGISGANGPVVHGGSSDPADSGEANKP